MSEDVIKSGEFERFAKSITENNRDVKKCLEKLTAHMINSDKRHEKTDNRVTALAKTQDGMKKDISKILKIVNQRQGFFSVISSLGRFGKFAVTAILVTLIGLSVTGIYNYVTKPATIIIPEPPKDKKP